MNEDVIGWLGCIVAVVMFGTQTIFVKPKLLTEKAKMHSNIVILAYSFGIFIFGLGLLICIASGALGGSGPVLTWEGVGQAVVFSPAKILLVLSVRLVGVAVAGAVVAGVMSTFAWFIGTVCLGEPFQPTAIPGIMLFLFGVLGMSYVKFFANSSLLAPLRRRQSQYMLPRLLQSVFDLSGSSNRQQRSSDISMEGDVDDDLVTKNHLPFFRSQMGGIMMAVLSGFFFSLQGVPLHFSPTTPLRNGAACYIVTMPIMLLINVPLILSDKKARRLSWKEMLDVRHDTTMQQSLRLVGIPMVGGLLFSIGGIGQELGVEYLGSAVALPVTQLQLIVAGLWGILLYKEIYQRSHIVVYFLFAIIAVGGALLLHPP